MLKSNTLAHLFFIQKLIFQVTYLEFSEELRPAKNPYLCKNLFYGFNQDHQEVFI